MSARQVMAARKRAATMSREAMFNVVRAPVITEKATVVSERNQFVFRVAIDATKPVIMAAVDGVWGVTGRGVNPRVHTGKPTRCRGRPGVRSDVKKAYVQLAEGQSIDMSTGLS